MRLRNSLMLLTAAATLPVVAFAMAAAVYVLDREQDNLKTAAQNRNRAALAAADAQVLATINALRALSAVTDSSGDRLASLRAQAVKVLNTQPTWLNIFVQSPTGEHMLNARLAGAPLRPSKVVEAESFNQALATRQPVVGHLPPTPLPSGEVGLPVRLPVSNDDGTVQYVITAVVNPNAFQQQLQAQNLPADWVSGLVDAKGFIIARVPAVPVGTQASKDFRARTQAASEGWYRGRTLEGRDTFSSFLRSGLTGWSIGYAIPAEQVVGPIGRLSLLLGTGILASLLAATAIVVWLTRRIARSVEDLVAASGSIGTGTLQARDDNRIEELHRLRAAMCDADQKLWTRSQELQSAGEALQRQAAELQRANTNKSNFLATLAHELRNPLAPMKNVLAIFDKTDVPGDSKPLRAMMSRQLTQMTRLIDDLLDVSRIDRGQLSLERQRLSVEVVLRSAVETAQPGFAAKNQRLVVESPGSAAYVEGDALRLAQVVGNLLNNASKFSPEKATVVLSARVEVERAVITVSDDGPGFEPARAEEIFGMFVQLQPPHTAGPGLGIGLSLARSIVEMHGGVIRASSLGPGQGAVFEMRLPLSSAQEHVAATSSASPT